MIRYQLLFSAQIFWLNQAHIFAKSKFLCSNLLFNKMQEIDFEWNYVNTAFPPF